jgi:hypothetical protein
MNYRRNNEQNFLLLNPFEHTVSLYDIPGLLIAVRKDYFRVINHRELLFNDCGDRVAQLLHVELAAPCSPCRNNDTRQEILIVNTHLLFPHDSSLSLVRLNQVSTFFHRVSLFFLSSSQVTSYYPWFWPVFYDCNNRSTKSCSMWNLIRKKTSLAQRLLCFAGNYMITWCMS